MDERSGTVRLIEPAPEARGPVVTVQRMEVERALRSDEGPVDLLLDVERASGGDGRETQRIALGWEPQDLERLLEMDGDEISLMFDEGELQRLLDEDVEAHGMRETLAVLTVAAGMAAAGAGSAFAMPTTDSAGGTATPAATRVTASEMSTGLGSQQTSATGSQPGRSATASEISTGITGDTPVASEVSTGITAKPTAAPASADQPSWSPSTTEGLAAAGAILALTAVGFAMRSRRGPQVAT